MLASVRIWACYVAPVVVLLLVWPRLGVLAALLGGALIGVARARRLPTPRPHVLPVRASIDHSP